MKAILQCWLFVIASGVIGMIALNWNGSYEKGSPIDIIKTHIPKPTEVRK